MTSVLCGVLAAIATWTGVGALTPVEFDINAEQVRAGMVVIAGVCVGVLVAVVA